MAVFNVTNILDMGVGSLRQAIADANGSMGADIIQFDSSLNGTTIGLTSGELLITDSLTINGLGANNLTIARTVLFPEFRIFNIDDGNASIFDVTINDLTITGGFLSGNDFPDNSGGGIFNAEDLTLNDAIVTGNVAVNGGGIENGYQAALSINSSTISMNSAFVYGGGIDNVVGSVTIENSTIADNEAGEDGGGIHNLYGSVNINKSTINNNQADDDGGGIDNYYGTLTIENTTISNNAAGEDGGGIGIDGENSTTLIDRSAIADNSAGDDGGGIQNDDGTLTVTNSTISGNNAEDIGGGIYSDTNLYGITTGIINSTISGNTASYYGGGIANYAGLTVISNSTVTNNEAPDGLGSGIASYSDNYTATLVGNSIISGNVNSDVDVLPDSGSNSFFSSGGNIIGTGNAVDAFTETGDQTGITDPLLGPLANNGGFMTGAMDSQTPILTHNLLEGSPALDNGLNTNVPAILVTDQRGAGFPRINGTSVDSGAIEFTVVPEPSSLVLVGLSATAMLGKLLRRKLTKQN